MYDNYEEGLLRYAIYKAYCQGACYDYVTFLSLAYFHISRYPLPTEVAAGFGNGVLWAADLPFFPVDLPTRWKKQKRWERVVKWGCSGLMWLYAYFHLIEASGPGEGA